ncbi:MAG: DHH family phosphoesterase [Candidatus Omnitrophica bacterium]|nr:DHH family phosphoesterase [Candidatus Omnitrophota bacterium]
MTEAEKRILQAKSVVIAGHIHPDGDCIGSMLALGLGLEGLGKRVFMVSYEDVPHQYRHLPGAERIVKKISAGCDVAIAVDCGSKEMLGGAFAAFKKSRCIVEIDHHAFRIPFGDLGIIDTHASCVGEIVFTLLNTFKTTVTKDIAKNILTSIIVETSSFRLPKVRAFTFEVCRRLMQTGMDFYSLVDSVFWSKNKEAAILSGMCLARCKFMHHGKLAWSSVRRADIKRMKGKDEDVDTVADEIRSIKGVEIAIFFREKSKRFTRVSLRSKGSINAGKLAQRYGGGGHFDVAGCLIPNNTKEMQGFLKRACDMVGP